MPASLNDCCERLSEQGFYSMKESNMARSRSTTIPKFGSLDELVQFFYTRDMGRYWEQMPDVEFEPNVIKVRKHLVAIDEEIVPRLNRIAKSKKISSESLINKWLREKLSKAG
jgi:hypothetical protein